MKEKRDDKPAGSGKSLLAVRIVFLNRVQTLQIHVMRANQYIQSIFRIQNSEYAFHFIGVFSVDFQKHTTVPHILMPIF